MATHSSTTLQVLLGQIHAKKKEIDDLRPLTSEQDQRIFQKFRLDWNYHSNAIEGNSLNYGETIAFLLEGLTAKGKPFKDHLDIKGHNDSIDFLMHYIQNRREFSEKMIRELHQILLVEPYSIPAKSPDGKLTIQKMVKPGVYKSLPNHVETPTKLIHYYATPEATPSMMTDLIDWLRKTQDAEQTEPLILAATFHHRFVAIHPFDDGNGRMSRLLMNLILMQYGYPPVIIRQDDRQQYYYALRQADSGDLGAFITYIGQNLLHSLNIQLLGAKGLSMEEDDDLEKEIALLKLSLGNKEVIAKSIVVLNELVVHSILPLFKTIQENCNKLDDLFFEKMEVFTTSFRNTESKFKEPNWVEIQDKWKEGLLTSKELHGVYYEYVWTNPKRISEPLFISYTIYIHFRDSEYDISFSKSLQENTISKSYQERVSPEEIQKISRLFVKSALEKIKQYSS